MDKQKLLKNLNKELNQEPKIQPKVQIFYPEKFLELLKEDNKAFREQILKFYAEGKQEQAKEIAEYRGEIQILATKLEEAIKSSKVERVEVTNLDFPELPEFPKSFSIEKPKWYEKFNPKTILSTIKQGFEFQSKSFESALDRHKLVKNALAVRLVDREGKTFYDAIATAYSTGANTSNLAKEITLQSLAKALTSDGTDSLDVNIIGGSSSGTQYTEGDTDATITGTALMWEDAANTLVPVSSTKPLPVSASIDTTGLATTTTDTNTGTIAGDTTSIDSKIPALGQALAAASVPVVLTAAQITTLTPPAAITGFATEATLASIKDTDGIKKITDPVAVTGTFWQATQPVSGTVTANLSATDNAVLDAIAASLDTIDSVDFATQTTLAALNAKVTAVNTGAVVVSSSALPSGAATAANQQTDALTDTELRAADVKITLDSEEVTTNIKPLTSCGSGVTTVTTAGTQVALGSSTAIDSVTIKALSTNTGLIYVGASTVSSTDGFQLSAGDSVSLDVDNLTDVYVDSAENGEGVSYIFVT